MSRPRRTRSKSRETHARRGGYIGALYQDRQGHVYRLIRYSGDYAVLHDLDRQREELMRDYRVPELLTRLVGVER